MFIVDDQTRSDLSIFKRIGGLYELFDGTRTVGGGDVLREYFYRPLSTVQDIQARQCAIQSMADFNLEEILDKFMFDDLERYLRLPNEPYSSSKFAHYLENINIAPSSIRYEQERVFIKRSISEIADLIIYLEKYFNTTDRLQKSRPNYILSKVREVMAHFDIKELTAVRSKKLSLKMIIKYDHLFRNSHKNKIRALLDIFYELDALLGIANRIKNMQLVFPVFDQVPGSTYALVLNGTYNPFLNTPVKNDVQIETKKNIWFLTGANMTGKSTLLKTIGIAVFLAHIGLPVPADKMIMIPFDGLLTTINLGDDIEKGRSHFFSEIFRLKFMAETLRKGKRLVVIVDELFKGTNYDDAYQATIELINNLAKHDNSIFLISSHLTGVVEELACDRIAFKYLLTVTKEDQGIDFTYKLETGVAKQKLGMWLLKKEKIFELLNVKTES